VLYFDQNTSEKAKIVTTFGKADHSLKNIRLIQLFRRIVKFVQVELLWDGNQIFEYTDTLWFDTPAQVECVNFWERILK
jgi:hypothetical protein